MPISAPGIKLHWRSLDFVDRARYEKWSSDTRQPRESIRSELIKKKNKNPK